MKYLRHMHFYSHSNKCKRDMGPCCIPNVVYMWQRAGTDRYNVPEGKLSCIYRSPPLVTQMTSHVSKSKRTVGTIWRHYGHLNPLRGLLVEETTVVHSSCALCNLKVLQRVHKFRPGTYPEPVEYSQ